MFENESASVKYLTRFDQNTAKFPWQCSFNLSIRPSKIDIAARNHWSRFERGILFQ